MSSNSSRLFLFDCDGGRSNLFLEFPKNQIPSTDELYLFWNNTDENINKKLQQLKVSDNIHLVPSYKKNVKDSADGKLIYFLGKLATKYDTITIVGGGDRIYEEVIDAVKADYPEKNIKLKEIQYPSSSELIAILNFTPRDAIIRIVPNQRIRCPECPKKSKTYLPAGLRSHLLGSKRHSKKIIEVSENHLSSPKNSLSCSTAEIKLIHPSLQQGILETSRKSKKCPLCLASCKQKYKAITLYEHLKKKHPQCNDVKIQCCNKQITYDSLDQFRQHALTDPFNMTYKIYA
ncbi:hypothetical protein I4U23_004205 [Adineta vaga]|nr:hypothetical protein I4U23_004205 [Adineta vaga]